MSNSNMKDLPKIKKLLADIKMMKSIQSAMPLLQPILQQFGVDTSKMSDALASIEELERQIDELSSLPDRFNDLFASSGWIMYDSLNLDIVRAAIKKAESGNLSEAEADIAAHYSYDMVKLHLNIMIGVKAFRPRMTLARKALEDYREERYYSSTMVILALTDGLVSELSPNRRGLSATDVDLQAWDSIAGHSKGLNSLVRMFQTGRRTTRTDEITIPYRHGIMHGMDLGFDNKLVAAKVWAALFAVRDWALKAEKGELAAPPENPQPTIAESITKIQEVVRDKARMDSWEPRNLILGVNLPTSGTPQEYEEGSPERVLVDFLEGVWKLGDKDRFKSLAT